MEEVVDSIMVFMFGLFCYMYIFVKKSFVFMVVGWFGFVYLVCKGMCCCKGFVVGIVGLFVIVCVVVVWSFVF